MRRAKRRLLPALLVTIVAAALSWTACKSCDSAPPCRNLPTWFECNDGECHPCCIDEDCLDNPVIQDCEEKYIICNDDYECECVCYHQGEDCSRDPGSCCQNLACDVFTNTCVNECSSDTDCAMRSEIPFHGNLKCKNGVCAFDHCRIDADCAQQRVCFYGNCVTKPECSEIDFCKILPAAAVTRQGVTTKLAATAYMKNGFIAPSTTFSWHSDNETAAYIDDGIVTGSIDTGTAIITAAVEDCSISCDAAVWNHAPVVSGHTRVVVVDLMNGTPVSGATVQLGSQTPVSTNDIGAAKFALEISSNPADITMSHHDYHYVTYRQVAENDVVVHMERVEDPMKAGGIKAKLDFGMVRCEPPQRMCDVTIGFGGVSTPPTLHRLKIDVLLGQMVRTPVELGGSIEEMFLPAGFTLRLNQTWFKEHAYSRGAPGDRIAWAYGGKIDLADLLDKLGPVFGDGGMGDVFVAMLPLYRDFFTDIRSNASIAPIPQVEDLEDLNGNNRTDDLIPDYLGFPEMDLKPTVGNDYNRTFTFPELPVGIYDSVLIIAGVVVPGAGLLPLGVGAAKDSLSKEDTPDGIIEDPVVVHYSGLAGRIPEANVQHVFIALAYNEANLIESTPLMLGAQILLAEDLSSPIELPPFMTPAVATYDPSNWHLRVEQLPEDADCTQVIFRGDNNASWHVLSRAETGSYYLPLAPPEGDRSKKATLLSIRLSDEHTYQSLPAFNDKNLNNIIEAVEAFSYSEDLEPPP